MLRNIFLVSLVLFGSGCSSWSTWAYLAAQNPPWPPTYDMRESLISMQCNSSGFSSPSRGADFGIISYDWSNAKKVWAAAKPMSSEDLLLQQAISTKDAGAKHVFVYRNIVKALPWFKTVREKLDDPAYEGFFLKFKQGSSNSSYHVPPCAAENKTHCSSFYHDQLQTPEVPTPSHPHPDGSCVDYCDCGRHPCGEYLFDHRNGTMLREWIVKEVVLGHTAVGHPAIDGLFLDDYWCSNLLCAQSSNQIEGCPCDDPAQGPTEINPYSQLDMGLSEEDIAEITIAWNQTMSAVEEALLEHQGYTWWLMYGQVNANAMPVLFSSNSQQCTDALREACGASPQNKWQTSTVLFGFTVDHTTNTLTHFIRDLAFFMLARGPYAYAGWGQWGMTWPFHAEPAHGFLPPLPHGVPLPQELSVDYGVPMGLCSEISSGVFVRKWTRAIVELDCNSFDAEIRLTDNESVKADTAATAM